MSASTKPDIVTREVEARVLRMFIGGAAQYAIVRDTCLSKGTVSKLINGVYPFVPNAGQPCKDLLALRDAATKRTLGQYLQKSMRCISQLQVTLGVAA